MLEPDRQYRLDHQEPPAVSTSGFVRTAYVDHADTAATATMQSQAASGCSIASRSDDTTTTPTIQTSVSQRATTRARSTVRAVGNMRGETVWTDTGRTLAGRGRSVADIAGPERRLPDTLDARLGRIAVTDRGATLGARR